MSINLEQHFDKIKHYSAVPPNVGSGGGLPAAPDYTKELKLSDVEPDKWFAKAHGFREKIKAHHPNAYDPIEGNYEFSKGSETIKTKKLTDLLDERGDIESRLKDAKDSGSPPSIKRYEDRLKDVNKRLDKQVKSVSGELDKHYSMHQKAADALYKEDLTKLYKLDEVKFKERVEELKVKHSGAIDTEAYKKDYQSVQEAHEKALDQAKGLLEKEAKFHEDHVKNIEDFAKDLKEKGIDIKLGGTTTSKAGEDLSKAGGELGVLEKLWSKNGPGGKTISGLGALAVLHGGYKIISPDVNPETGKSEISGGNVAEAGAGMLALISQVMSNKGVQAAVKAIG